MPLARVCPACPRRDTSAKMKLLMMLRVATTAAVASAATHLHPPVGSRLQVPDDLAIHAQPIWSADGAQFVMARAEFGVSSKTKKISSAVAFVTAQLSPFCQPDARLVNNDYGACLPRGGTSQPKLFGAYKLFVNGALVGMGPGRLVNQTQGVDAIDITSVIARDQGSANAIGLQGYHSRLFQNDTGRLLFHLVVHFEDGSSETPLSTGGRSRWDVLNADKIFNPSGSSGAWAGSAGFPHERLDMRAHPQSPTQVRRTRARVWISQQIDHVSPQS
eukprot:SAG31_NODE_285_length_18479_cov_9.871980_12_plen_275_part_00